MVTVVMIIKVFYKLTQNKHYNCFQLLHDTKYCPNIFRIDSGVLHYQRSF